MGAVLGNMRGHVKGGGFVGVRSSGFQGSG